MRITAKNPNKLDNSLPISIFRSMKFWWSLILILIDLIVLTIFKTETVSLCLDKGIYFQIPIAYWIELSILFPVLYLASRFANRRWQILVLVLLFFFAIYSSNLFLVIPYQQTDRSIHKYGDILRNTSYIGQEEISLDDYFQWPVFFLFLKMLDLILNTTMNHLITIGLFIFDLLLAIFLLFFIDEKIDLRVLFLTPIIYILVSYHFIVDQFAPQMMGLLYLILIFGLYYRFRVHLRFKFLLLFIYSILVFTHPFTFLFFLGSIFIEYLDAYFLKKTDLIPNPPNRTTINFVFLLATIYCVGFVYRFFSTYSAINYLVYNLGFGIGETIGEVWNFMGVAAKRSGMHLLYRLVPEVYSKTFSNLSRVTLVLFVIIFLVGLAIKRKKIDIKNADISIVAFGAILYALGLITVFLGQRSLQLITLPISKIYGELIRNSRMVLATVGILIAIAPTLFIITDIINISIDGGMFIQDEEMDYAGQFVDHSSIKGQNVISFPNSYPTGYPEQLKIFNGYEYLRTGNQFNQTGMVINTPKAKLMAECFGIDIFREIYRPNAIYDNGATTVVFNGRDRL